MENELERKRKRLNALLKIHSKYYIRHGHPNTGILMDINKVCDSIESLENTSSQST